MELPAAIKSYFRRAGHKRSPNDKDPACARPEPMKEQHRSRTAVRGQPDSKAMRPSASGGLPRILFSNSTRRTTFDT